MKLETKELIDLIKKQINLSGECIVAQPNEHWKEDKTKAMNFLDSLPQIESHLYNGGYIQDKNGTPCCDGDEVVFTYCADCINVPKKKGQLKWSIVYKQFVIIVGHKVSNKEHEYLDEYTFDDILEFEKSRIDYE